MKKFLAVVLNRKTRLWLYGIGVALTGWLGIRGVLNGEEVAYINFALTLVLGLAILNVPSSDKVDPPPTSPAANAVAEDNTGVPEQGPQPPLW